MKEEESNRKMKMIEDMLSLNRFFEVDFDSRLDCKLNHKLNIKIIVRVKFNR